MHRACRRGGLWAIAVASSLGAVVLSASVPDVAAAPPPSWTSAALLPGVAVLNVGGQASAQEVACPTGTSCVAVGTFRDAHGFTQGFVATMKDGTWQPAVAVPGLASLNVGGSAGFADVACSSAGNCSATGTYTNKSKRGEAFVVNELAGRWHDAEPVPGVATLQGKYTRQLSSFGTVTCVPGTKLDCELGGSISALSSYYANGASQAVVDSEKNGVWGTAAVLPWPAGEGSWSNVSWVGALSCPLAGDCTTVVNVGASTYSYQGTFIDTETNYKWSRVAEVPGLTKFNEIAESQDQLWGYSLACPSLGNCVAVGAFHDFWVPFTATETSKRWGTAAAISVPADQYSQALAVSCASVSRCSLVGLTQSPDGDNEYIFESDEVSGHWTAGVDIPGLATLGNDPTVSGFSCDAADTCVLAGSYFDESGGEHPYVAMSVGGTWQSATTLPGASALPGTGAEVNDVSCAPDGGCALVGNTITAGSASEKAFYSDLPPAS